MLILAGFFAYFSVGGLLCTIMNYILDKEGMNDDFTKEDELKILIISCLIWPLLLVVCIFFAMSARKWK